MRKQTLFTAKQLFDRPCDVQTLCAVFGGYHFEEPKCTIFNNKQNNKYRKEVFYTN